MEFRDSYRMEAIYFQTLKEEINRVKALMASGNTEQAKTLLENAVNVDGAVLLLYRNLGELWGELGAKIEEAKKELEKLDSRVNDYHRELNEKIDDVNNTIIRIINALEERVRALEECCEEVQEALENKQDKLTPGIGITIDENNVISAGGGSGGIEFIAFNYDENNNIVCDKTINEIVELLEDKKFCVGVLNPDDEPNYLYVNNYDINQTFGTIIIFKTLTDVDTFISQSQTIVCEQEETGAPGSGDFTDTFYEQYNTQNGTLIISAGNETPVIDPEDAMIIRQNVLNEHIIIKFTKLVDGSGSTFFYHFQSCRQTQNSPYVFMCTDIRNNAVVHHVMEIVIGSGGSNTITLTDY